MIHATLKSKWDEDICLMLTIDNDKWNYLCDCGSASLLKPGECLKTRAIFISHTHVDHFINFDTIMRHQLGLGKLNSICGPKGIAENVRGKLLGYQWNLIETDSITYEIREVNEQGRIAIYHLKPPKWELNFIKNLESNTIFKGEEFSVSYTILDHGIPSIAYLFQENTKLKIKETPYAPGAWISLLKKAYRQNLPEMEFYIGEKDFRAKDLFHLLYEKPGYKVGFVMDHLASSANHEKIIDLCKDADVLFIEAYYRKIDEAFAKKNYHSTAQASGEVARKAGVQNVYFIHHSRRYSTEIEDLIEEARASFENRDPIFKDNPIARF
ncbi:MAG: peptidase [Bacteroidota bacterium]